MDTVVAILMNVLLIDLRLPHTNFSLTSDDYYPHTAHKMPTNNLHYLWNTGTR